MLGRTLAHYEIRERLGAGGMGEVYRAHDTRLGRDVALKVLPSEATQDPSLRQRLEQEARAVASLHHPNIVTLFSVEKDQEHLFLTMELVRGPQLSQLLTADGLDLPRLLELALPLTEAVGTAHENGLVHRDLKPANIMLDEKGRVKILDFGLAKQLRATNPLEDATVQMSLTNAGGIVGTCDYMSPEQAQGDEVDTRSDIFSLGIILYEMACGRRPFVGANPISILSSILKDQPAPIQEINASVPSPLVQIIMRCLEKDPERRWRNAGELHAALAALKHSADTGNLPLSSPGSAQQATHTGRRLALVVPLLAIVALGFWWLRSNRQRTPEGTGSQASTHTLVVFPFENQGEPGDNYFADGVTDEIVSRLTTIKGIGVISRTSAMRYDRTGKSLAQIAKDLNVDYVLEGTIRWDRVDSGSSRLRITPQLVRVDDQMSVWSQSYDRELSDVFMLQSEIARQVVNSIDASLIPAAQAQPTGVHTENLEAYDLYLQAKQYMQWRMGPSKVELLRADALLERALALDAGFAAAHASLSRVSSAMVFRGFDRSESRTALAESAADRALQLDPELAEAHLAKGLYIYRVLRDYPAALGELQVARELAPGEAEILSWIGTIWKRQGKFESAANILQRALRMDPYNPTVPAELAIVYRSMGEFSQALDATDKAIALNPSFRAKLSRVNLLERWTGDLAPRRQLLEESGPGHRFQWAVLHAQERRFAEALATLDSIRADRADSPQESLAAAVLRARIFWARGESAAQHQTSEEALSIIEAQQVEDIHMQRGIAYALLGREEEALRESALALQENPPTLDVLRASDMAFSMAFIHAVLGNVPEAVQWLEQSHQLARSFTAQFLKIDFLWDPIRNHPEFRSFMRRLETNS